MRRSLWTVLACASLVAAGCGGDAGPSYEVTSEVASHADSSDILVFAPDAEGPWPIVWALHGTEGRADDFAETATALAEEGVVVFAGNYAGDTSKRPSEPQVVRDTECNYRFARSIAAGYGGDLSQPVTFVGFSLGASMVLERGLNEEVDASEPLDCFAAAPRPDIVVAIAGCHFELEGRAVDLNLDEWANEEAEIVFVAGTRDVYCPAWQSEDAAAALRAAGYDVELVVLDGAEHFAPIFHDTMFDEWITVADDPAGKRTVEVILDAIASRQASAGSSSYVPAEQASQERRTP